MADAQVATENVSREVTITRLIDAPRDVVFKAFIEPEQIAKWWGPEGFTVPKCESDPRPGGALLIVMRGPDGGDHPMAGTYLEVDEPSRLVLESGAEGPDGAKVLEATITVAFVERGGKTEITVHARAHALAPEAIAMLAGMEAGWSQSLQCLDDVLTGAGERQIVIMRMLDAPREVVFEAFTDREQVNEWWGPTGFTLSIESMDVRPGGEWRFVMHGPDGVDYPNLIVYEEVTPPQRLVFAHSDPTSDEAAFRGIVTFDDFEGKTVLTLRSTFVSAEARDEVVAKHNAIEGGNQTLDRLGEHLAGLASKGS